MKIDLITVREIRARVTPAWEADEVDLTFLFIRDEDRPGFAERRWGHYLGVWLKRLHATGRFTSIYGMVQALDELTARAYVESDPLDLDHLSSRDDDPA